MIVIYIDLPSGLSLNRKAGVISGVTNEICDRNFIITAKSIWNEVKTEIGLVIESAIILFVC